MPILVTTFGSITPFPATSRFSLLPPDNATGNFVKTIQRLPVKISLNTTNDPENKITSPRYECRCRCTFEIKNLTRF
jgi:multidrug resistance efflux pump